MKAYELNAKVNANGELEIPKLPLHLQQDTVVRIIVLVNESNVADEPDETGFSTQSFQKSWQQAVNGDTLPLSQLWEGLDVD
jgi:hypothetical protein